MSALCLAAFALLGLPSNPGLHSLTCSFPVGERLVYEGMVEKAGLSVNVGEAVFTVNKNEDNDIILKAVAKGHKFGYTLDTTLSSAILAGSTVPFIYHYLQRGSEWREKKIVFENGEAVYWRLKHCKDYEHCHNPKHMVESTNWVGGIIPWGTHKVHCRNTDCRIRDHYYWKRHTVHHLDRPYVDLLTAIYYARNLDLRLGAPEQVVPIVQDKELWLIKLRVKKQARLTVKAGTYDALELILTPVAVKGKLRDEFKGLFGLNGDIHLWIDRASHRPILIQGTIPFAFLDLTASVELVKVGKTSDGKG